MYDANTERHAGWKLLDTRLTAGRLYGLLTESTAVHYLLLAGITLGAIALRFYKLDAWSFWIDEIYTLDMVDYANRTGSWYWPPALNMARIAVALLGVNEWSARLPAAIIGVVSVPLLYLPTRKAYGPIVALIAALLLAVSPWHLYWSQNARFYVTILLLYNLALFAFLFGVEERRLSFLLAGFLLFVVAAWERLMALFLVPVVLSYLLLATQSSLTRRRAVSSRRMRTTILVAALALPVVALLLLTINQIAVHDLLTVFIGNPNHSPVRLFASFVFHNGLPLTCLAIFTAIYALRTKKRRILFAALSAILPLALLILISPFTFTVDRYVFITLPSWIILGAIAVNELLCHSSGSAKILALGVFALLVGDFLAQDLLYYTYQNGYRPDWRSTFAVIAQQAHDDDLVVTTRPELSKYYLATQPAQWIKKVTPESLAREQRRAWIIQDPEVDDTFGSWLKQNATLIDVFETNVPGRTLTLRLYLYSHDDTVKQGMNEANRP